MLDRVFRLEVLASAVESGKSILRAPRLDVMASMVFTGNRLPSGQHIFDRSPCNGAPPRHLSVQKTGNAGQLFTPTNNSCCEAGALRYEFNAILKFNAS